MRSRIYSTILPGSCFGGVDNEFSQLADLNKVDLPCSDTAFYALRFIRLLLLTTLVIAISGCDIFDGGGGNDDQVTPPTEPPVEPPFVNAVIVDGKEWLQPADFTGYIFQQINDVCPAPAGVCSGSLQGSTFDLTGYTWASIMDVSSLFNAYGVNPPFTEPFQYREDDDASLAMSRDFEVTANFCFGDCPYTWILVAGMVRDPAPAGALPYQPIAFLDSCARQSGAAGCTFSNTSGFGVGGESDGFETPSDDLGVWFWRPFIGSELDTVTIDGKKWLQPADFPDYAYDQVSVTCPAGVCSGRLPGSTFDLTGYTWASIDEVSALFNAYGLNPPFTEPFQTREDQDAAIAISGDFENTGSICDGDCNDVSSILIGMVRDQAPAGESPYTPFVAEDHFANTPSIVHPDAGVGIWFWRLAEPDIVTVDGREWAQVDQFTNLSWNDINDVCPMGICIDNGVLNGHNMTGWTWASVDDVNALFNYYIGSDELGSGPDYLSDSNSANSVWGPAFFRDGWRATYSHPNVLRITQGWVSGVLGLGDGYLSYLMDVEDEGGWINDELDTRKTPLISDDVGGWFYRTP
jgi:hypothetical protein